MASSGIKKRFLLRNDTFQVSKVLIYIQLIMCAVMITGCASNKASMDSGLKTLWVMEIDSLSDAEQMLAVTLQGLVARDETAIWIADTGINAILLDNLDGEGIEIRKTVSVWELLRTFSPHIKGGIVYTLGTDSLNVATSLSGSMQAVAVDASIADRFQAQGFEILLDVRDYDEARAFDEYQDLFTHGILIEQTENKTAHLRDFAVSRGAFTYFNVDPDAFEKFASTLGPDPLVYGWGGDEYEWVHRISQSGGAGIPADWSRNLSVLERLPALLPERPHRYPKPAKEGERIVAFVMSDGDNIQWMGGRFATESGFWASPYRGQFNMTWEMAPTLVEVSPRVLAYFYETASDSRKGMDDFVVGPSGIGYTFHNYLPDRRVFAENTVRMMRMSDLSIVTMLNANGGMEQSAELLEQSEVLGVIYKDYAPYNAKQGRIYWHDGKPCVSYRYLLWDPDYKNSPEGVAEALAKLPDSPQTDPDSYALINVHAWSFKDIGGPMEAVKRTIDLLPPKTRVVTAEEFIVLLRNNFGSQVNP
jgi:hypothetical protein